MRRISALMLVPAVLLALGVGVLVGRAVDDDGTTAASDKDTKVLGSVVTRPETTTTTEAEATTTTVEATTTTTQAATAAATTTTTARPAVAGTTTTTAARPAVAGCGSGSASAGANLVINGSGPPSNPTFTYSGQASVVNNTNRAIEVDVFVLRMTSANGTVEEAVVPGAKGAVIEPGATRDFPFGYTTKNPPKDKDGVTVAAFSYRPPGGTQNCT